MPRSYETMIITRPDLSEEAMAQFIDGNKALLQEGGATNLEVLNRGKRRLAYEIARCKEGVYLQLNYDADPGARTAMEKALRLNESILRFATFNLDKD